MPLQCSYQRPKTSIAAATPPYTGKIAVGDYLAVMGGVGHSTCETDATRGWACGGGMLVPNAWHPFADCLDGTSNVFMVAECSGWVFDAANNRDRSPRLTGTDSRWVSTRIRIRQMEETPSRTAGQIPNNGRCWHETTINQPIGDRIYVGADEGNDCCNKPIVSEHPGGSHVAMVDGSVRFATNSMDYQNSVEPRQPRRWKSRCAPVMGPDSCRFRVRV